MTEQSDETQFAGPDLSDLVCLHRYARSRHFGEKLSTRAFAKQLGTTKERVEGIRQRLEKSFNVYLMSRRPKWVHEEEMELVSDVHVEHFRAERRQVWKDAEETRQAAAALNGVEPSFTMFAPEYSAVNKSRLSLAGEIFGEVASICVGYLTLAKLGTKSGPNGYLVDPVGMHRFLGWLQEERRRIHRLVVSQRQNEGAEFNLGWDLPDDHFDKTQRLAIDVQDMAKVEASPYDSTYDGDDHKEEEQTALPYRIADRSLSPGGLRKRR